MFIIVVMMDMFMNFMFCVDCCLFGELVRVWMYWFVIFLFIVRFFCIFLIFFLIIVVVIFVLLKLYNYYMKFILINKLMVK